MKYIQIQVCHLCSHHKLGLVNKFERKMKWKKKKLRDWKGLSFRNASLELSILSMSLCIYWSFGVKECNKELHFWFSWWIWENISKLVIELTNLENRNGKTFFSYICDIERWPLWSSGEKCQTPHQKSGQIIKRNRGMVHRTQPRVGQYNQFLDDNGIIHVNGRIGQSHLSYHQKYPMILPRNHHVTCLL